ncbi:uncharacterized protein C8R40DRAFT_1269564 [Lentinula edodes]|nr:uncharacterized protein C8R40DRAFT_1269564 [Lentinula edodes]KAH7867619.1 hypothetical protein C8R40DRAFT_1269564 [Lentinula edodes]
MAAIQNIVRNTNKPSITKTPFWSEFKKLFDLANTSAFPISPSNAQDLAKLILTLQRQFATMNMDNPYLNVGDFLFQKNLYDPSKQTIDIDRKSRDSASSHSSSSSSTWNSSHYSLISDAEVLNYARILEHVQGALYTQALAKFSADAFEATKFAATVKANYDDVLPMNRLTSLCYKDSGSDDVASFIATNAAFDTANTFADSQTSGLPLDKTTWFKSTVQNSNPWRSAFIGPLTPNNNFTIASNFIATYPSSNPPIAVTQYFPPIRIPTTAASGASVHLALALTETNTSDLSELFVAFPNSNRTPFEQLSSSDSYNVIFPTQEDDVFGTMFVLPARYNNEPPKHQLYFVLDTLYSIIFLL